MVAMSKGPPQSFDGQVLSRTAASVKLPRPTGNHEVDAQARICWDNTVRIIDRLMKRPEDAVPLYGLMISHNLGSVAVMRSPAKSKHEWTGEYKLVCSLPVAWLSGFLLAQAERMGLEGTLKESVLRALDDAHASNIPTLFQAVTQLPAQTLWPQELSDQALASQAMAARADEVGSRLKRLCEQEAFSTPGVIDWRLGGSFDLKFVDGRLDRVIHCSGAEATVPAAANLTTAYTFNENHMDHLARLELPPLPPLYLHSFFPASTFFRSVMAGRKFKRLQEITKNILDERKIVEDRTRSQTVEVAESVVDPASKKRAQASLEAARAKLAKAKEDRTKRMRLSLDDPSSLPALTEA